MMLPSFLRPSSTQTTDSASVKFVDAVAKHGTHDTHALWFPPKGSPETILLFIPGNPGCVGFYIPLLSHIVENSENVAVIAHAHVGHASIAPFPSAYVSLDFQIQNALEAYDLVHKEFPTSRIILVGHSLGTWICLQVSKQRPSVTALFLLCPTISNLAKTPNGRALFWIGRPPIPRSVSWMAHLLALVPLSTILSLVYRAWPAQQITVLETLLRHPSSIHACLSLANDEMTSIKELDKPLMNSLLDRVHLLYGTDDGWIGQEEQAVLHFLDGRVPAERLLKTKVPHAFCINDSELVATYCLDWLASLELVANQEKE